MNNLIKKAIDAIHENKTDYAVGILEALMELQGEMPKQTPLKLPVVPVVPAVNLEVTEDNLAAIRSLEAAKMMA